MYCWGVIPYIFGYVSDPLESFIFGLWHLGQSFGVGLVSFLCFSFLSTSRRFLRVLMFVWLCLVIGFRRFLLGSLGG